MDQKHEAGFSQLPGDRQPAPRPFSPFAQSAKSLFLVDLTAAAAEARDTLPGDFIHYPVARPPILQTLGFHKGIVLIVGMKKFRWRFGYPQSGGLFERGCKDGGIAPAKLHPAG